MGWFQSKNQSNSTIFRFFTYLSPFVLIGLFAYYLSSGILVYRSAAISLFFINLAVLLSQLKGLKKEIIAGSKIDEILKNYSLIISRIEQEEFKSDKLQSLKDQLKHDTLLASQEIKVLSNLFSQLDNLQNLVGAFITNGIFSLSPSRI